MRRRRRYGHYDLASPAFGYGHIALRVGMLVALVLILYVLGSWTLHRFGVGNAIREAQATLFLEDRGTVNVSIENGDYQRAKDGMKLRAGDRIASGANAHASLAFFDGSWLRTDENTEFELGKSMRGEVESEFSVELSTGGIWIATPPGDVFSGTIVRMVRTPRMSFTLPSRTEAVITTSSLAVFAADGIGVYVEIAGAKEPVIIGEGQQFLLSPGADLTGDLYAYRSALDPRALESNLVKESRAIIRPKMEQAPPQGGAASSGGTAEGDMLVITSPEDGATVEGNTITVSGRIGAAVTGVRVNGYQAVIDQVRKTFSQEISLPEEEEVSIIVQALGADGVVLVEVQRKIHHDTEPPQPPIITAPAQNGQFYRTGVESVEIEGTPPAGVVGIIVNDYRLQLFSPGDDTWSYLASTQLQNLHAGENIYEIFGIDGGGLKSDPAVLTIILTPGPSGVITEQEAAALLAGLSSQAPPPPASAQTSNNLPLRPGTLRVISPTTGATYDTEDVEFLIEGVTASETSTLWVNDYQLQLYTAGKTSWNYLASAEIGTLKRGRNEYKIVARDSQNRIVDTLTYIVNFRPGRL